jgi:hypothetical protein
LSRVPVPIVYPANAHKIGRLESDAMDVVIVHGPLEIAHDGIGRLMTYRTPAGICESAPKCPPNDDHGVSDTATAVASVVDQWTARTTTLPASTGGSAPITSVWTVFRLESRSGEVAHV